MSLGAMMMLFVLGSVVVMVHIVTSIIDIVGDRVHPMTSFAPFRYARVFPVAMCQHKHPYHQPSTHRTNTPSDTGVCAKNTHMCEMLLIPTTTTFDPVVPGDAHRFVDAFVAIDGVRPSDAQMDAIAWLVGRAATATTTATATQLVRRFVLSFPILHVQELHVDTFCMAAVQQWHDHTLGPHRVRTPMASRLRSVLRTVLPCANHPPLSVSASDPCRVTLRGPPVLDPEQRACVDTLCGDPELTVSLFARGGQVRHLEWFLFTYPVTSWDHLRALHMRDVQQWHNNQIVDHIHHRASSSTTAEEGGGAAAAATRQHHHLRNPLLIQRRVLNAVLKSTAVACDGPPIQYKQAVVYRLAYPDTATPGGNAQQPLIPRAFRRWVQAETTPSSVRSVALAYMEGIRATRKARNTQYTMLYYAYRVLVGLPSAPSLNVLCTAAADGYHRRRRGVVEPNAYPKRARNPLSCSVLASNRLLHMYTGVINTLGGLGLLPGWVTQINATRVVAVARTLTMANGGGTHRDHWLGDDDETMTHSDGDLDAPRVTANRRWDVTREHLVTEEIDRMLKVCTTHRDRLIILIMAHTGLRRRATAWIRLKEIWDVDTNTPRALARTLEKGSRVRSFVVDDEMVGVLVAYMHKEHPGVGVTTYLFCSKYDHRRHMAPKSVNVLVKRLAHRAGLPNGPHIRTRGFRKYIINELLDNGNSLQDVSKFVQHESTAVTQKFYVKKQTDSDIIANMKLPWSLT
jgi:integrase